MQKFAGVVVDSKGAPMTGVTVTVNLAGGSAATIYSDNGVTTKSNPFTNDANGSYEFYAADDRYDVVLSKTGVTFVAADTSDILLYDPGAPTKIYTDELTGLTLSNNGTDATNDIDIAVGAAASDDATIANRILMSLTAGLTKQLDAVWAAGTAAGGRISTQSLADGTWHVFLFRRSGGAMDVCFSNTLSFTLPDSGTQRRRLGSIVRTGAAIKTFVQDGDLFQWNVAVLDQNNVVSSTVGQTVTLTLPTGLNVEAIFAVIMPADAAGSVAISYEDLDVTDAIPSNTAAPLASMVLISSNITSGGVLRVRTNTSAQVRWRASATGGHVYLATRGWVDRRGRG